ncbi:MAG TPA: Fic family protein [Planctomycetota bacterium]|nr:Fic family protein [Planctomycetota bacterium]
MPYIHQQEAWPALTWDSGALSASLASVRNKQGRLLGRMEAFGFDLRTQANVSALTHEIVKSSAIEGERLDAAEVRSSIRRRLGLDVAGLPTPSRNVEGFVEVMLDATTDVARPLTKERLFRWHAALFPTARSGMHSISVGRWRDGERGPMQVVSGPLGKERVHFEAPDAARVEFEMLRFLDWFNSSQPEDAVLKAGVAHFWFVTIHPFDDGNGRLARTIADLALARSDGTTERFYSMSAQIEAERKDYYLVLEASQRGDTDITPWLGWFLRCLERAIDSAESVLHAVLAKGRVWSLLRGVPVNARQTSVLNRLLEDFEGALTTSKYAKLVKCSHDTALRDIQELVRRRVLVAGAGGGRSTSYSLAPPDGV